jgi:membrane protease YdiL (CAAX protease family)
MESMKQDMSAGGIGEQPRYWGLWATIGFSLIACFAFILIQMLTVVLLGDFVISMQPDRDPELVIDSLESNGLFLAIALLLTSVICSGLIITFAALHRQTPVKEYLHFLPVTLGQLLPYMGLMLLFAASYNGLCYLLDKPVVPDFMVTAYQSAVIYPLFFFTFIFAAPFLEELFFRGFLLDGLRQSFLGPVLAVISTAIFWGAIHTQYELLEIIFIVGMGVMLGYARIKTRSIFTPFAMHAMVNAIAIIEVASLTQA